jgi:iron-sulfur cluster repair protein YtfE (RIC family)
MFEVMMAAVYFSGDLPYVARKLETQSMEDLDTKALQLLQEIRDELVALNNSIDAQKRELESIESRKKRAVRVRRTALIERMLARYDATSVEFLDHIPYLVKRIYRIHRAGKPERTRPLASAAARSRMTGSRSRRA